MGYEISSSHGRRLLVLARDIIGHQLGLISAVNRKGLDEEVLQQRVGTFVTLKINNKLRGCIGNLDPGGTIIESIERNALSSAFHDYRFSPLEAEELAQVAIDISILTEAQQLHYRDGKHLLTCLRPGVDGVILCHGKAKATFLPQVWSQLPEPEQFLGHLCIKAGLSRTAWSDLMPEIYIYQVTYFEEEVC